MTSPRIIVPGATTAITRRTNLRKAFLAPWADEVQQCWLYSLADAQRHTAVDLHHGITVINHHHLLVTPERDNLPEFTRRVHADLSSSLNALLARHRYDSPRELFDGRIPHYQRLCDAPAQATRLVYDHLNCVSAGLVDRPSHMPGQVFDFDLWHSGYLDVRRPDVYFDGSGDRRPEVIRMRITPPPLLYEAFGGDLDRLVYYMKQLSDGAAQRLRRVRKRPAMGARAVRRLHPWSEPRSLRETGGQRIPSFSVGAQGALGLEQHIRAATETRAFRRKYREVRDRWKRTHRDEPFPFGTYEMRVLHGTPVDEAPDPDAIVTRPGPLLCDVRAALAECPKPTAQQRTQGPSAAVIAELRNAFDERAEQVCAQEAMEFVRGQDGPEEDTRRPVVRTRHRFQRTDRRDGSLQAGDEGAARVVVLRDRRRGRPAAKPSRHGTDPPA